MSQIMSSAKQPWEVFAIGIDFKNNMEDGESIDQLNSIVKIYVYGSNEDVSEDLIHGNIFTNSDTILLATIKGGISHTRYKASFRAYISETKKLEEDLIFDVKD